MESGPKAISISEIGTLAKRLGEAIDLLGELGQRIHPNSRLSQARDHLQELNSLGTFPSSIEERLTTTSAINAGLCIIRVADAIRFGIPEGMTHALSRVTSGRLEIVGNSMWHQAESELLFGVAVLLGGAEVQLPLIYDVKSPDFIADFRTLRYSVEVKRPSSSKKVARKISSAANQIASFQNQPAVIAVDLTDVLNANIENGNPDQLLSSLDMRLEEMHVAAIRQINRNTRRPGFSRVALLIFYARIIVWQRIRDCWGPSFGLVLRGKLFEGACSGVLADGPGRFLQGIIHGFERVAGGKVWRY